MRLKKQIDFVIMQENSTEIMKQSSIDVDIHIDVDTYKCSQRKQKHLQEID